MQHFYSIRKGVVVDSIYCLGNIESIVFDDLSCFSKNNVAKIEHKWFSASATSTDRSKEIMFSYI